MDGDDDSQPASHPTFSTHLLHLRRAISACTLVAFAFLALPALCR